MSDLIYSFVFILIVCIFSFFAKKYHISKNASCETINAMVKYCYNEKGQRVRI